MFYLAFILIKKIYYTLKRQRHPRRNRRRLMVFHVSNLSLFMVFILTVKMIWSYTQTYLIINCKNSVEKFNTLEPKCADGLIALLCLDAIYSFSFFTLIYLLGKGYRSVFPYASMRLRTKESLLTLSFLSITLLWRYSS